MGTSSHATESGLSALERIVLRGLAVSAGWIVVASIIYLVWQFPAWLACVSVVAAAIAFVYWNWSFIIAGRRLQGVRPGTGWPIALVALVTDALIIGTMLFVRTDEGIISPWQIVPLGIFLLFAIATAFTLFALPRMGQSWGLLLAIVHTFCAYGVSLLVYKLGFGFDPFVHEAATQYIVDHGSITPKQPFYTGQYVLVAALHHLTNLSIGFIQPILLPVLASILLPTLLTFRTWSTKASSIPYWILWILPFAYFTFTVPFNLAMLGFIICLFLLPIEGKDARIARVLITIATVTIHPLIGIPCFILVMAREASDRLGRYAFPITLLTTVAGLYGALLIYAFKSGGSITFPAAAEWVATLRILFSAPFELLRIAPWWSALYAFYFLCPWVFIFLGLLGLAREWKRSRAIVWLLPIATAVGIVIASILSAATLRYRNIIGHEQFEFALRLISLLPWILAIGLIPLTDYLRRIPEIVLALLLSFFAVSVWHVSYPQLNPVMHVFSPGVSRTDVLTVEAIERLAEGRPYVALVPQLTSAAALRKIGFERSIETVDGEIYPYAIPTGGYLYRRYLDLFEGRDVTMALEEVRQYAQTPIILIAVPIAWDNGELDEVLKKVSKERVFIDESMQIYLIERP